MKSKSLVLVIALICVFFLWFCGADVVRRDNVSVNLETIETEADKIIDACKNVDYKPECYDKVIPELMDKMSMNDAFRVVASVQKKDSTYAYCHVVAHKLSFIESKRRPDSWLNIMHSCPLNMCDYGCQHGVLVERYRGEVLVGADLEKAIVEMKIVCDPESGYDQPFLVRRSCYHGLGHVAMYITGGDLQKSLSICSDTWTKGKDEAFLKVCLEGVFMTVYQGVDPEDLALVADIKPKPDEVDDFCKPYEGIFFQSCHRESHPYFGERFRQSTAEAKRFCDYAKDLVMKKDCMAVVSYIRSLDTLSIEPKNFLQSTYEYCDEFKKPMRGWCYYYASYGLLEVDADLHFEKSLEICKQAQVRGVGNECFEMMVEFPLLRYPKSSEKSIDYCNRLPSEWKGRCLESQQQKKDD